MATKLSNFDPSTRSRKASIEMYRNSFTELQVDTIDYMLLHAVGTGGDSMAEFNDRYMNNGILDFLVEEREAGRIRNLGFSFHGDVKLYDYLLSQHDKYRWDFVQIQLNTPEGVLTVLSGMTFMEHLQDNLRSYTPLQPLGNDDLAFLKEIADDLFGLKTIPCNDCKYCMPCPYGIDIPAILTHYNKCINEGNIPRDQQDADYRKQRRAFLVSYDRAVPKVRQASHCIGCSKCVSHSPQGIAGPRELRK